MATLPAAGYISNNARSEGEIKVTLEDIRNFIAQQPGGSGETTLTISAGSITPTQFAHQVDTEGSGSTDDLTHIAQTNLPNGSLLLIRNVAAGRTVVVKHQAGGTGQIVLKDAADFSLLDPADYLLLKRQSTQWEELQRFRRADAFPGGSSGFRLLLDRDSAPVGWTRDTDAALNDRMVRIVTGTRTHGGSWTIGGLTMAHTHSIPGLSVSRDGWGTAGTDVAGRLLTNMGSGPPSGSTTAANGITTGSGTSGAASTSTVASDGTWRPLHRDLITVYPAN